MERSQTLSSVFIHLCKESEERNLSISAFAAYAIFERKLFTLSVVLPYFVFEVVFFVKKISIVSA